MKRLIICADGTWNTPDRIDLGVPSPSNVVKMARSIATEAPDGTTQIVFYDPGVGTDNFLDKLTGGAFGVGLGRNVRDAYLFLVHNYVPGDEIYFFGFSRGAFTVRSAAGLIRKAGILFKAHAERDLEAWNLYRRRDDDVDNPDAERFRDAYSAFPIRIRFIGVWDTVGALGIPGFLNFIARKRFQFHDVALSRTVDLAYQALAVDEKRKFFAPSLWEQHPEATQQVLKQAWFPGVHMDVGGGYKDASLSDGAFEWMVQMARSAGLAFDEEQLKRVTRPDPLGPMHESRGFPYTLIPAFRRPIGEGITAGRSVYGRSQSNEELHPSTELRYLKMPAYRPPGLVDYYGKHGEPR